MARPCAPDCTKATSRPPSASWDSSVSGIGFDGAVDEDHIVKAACP